MLDELQTPMPVFYSTSMTDHEKKKNIAIADAALMQSLLVQCSRCRTCVMEMDHHCIFLNSCVGLNNMRHFLLMLLYLIAGCAYTLVACVTLMWQERDAVKADWGR